MIKLDASQISLFLKQQSLSDLIGMNGRRIKHLIEIVGGLHDDPKIAELTFSALCAVLCDNWSVTLNQCGDNTADRDLHLRLAQLVLARRLR